MRFWNMTPPIATPMVCPKQRKKVNMAAAMAIFFSEAEAWIARAIAGKRRPIPMPETSIRKIQVGMEIVDERK